MTSSVDPPVTREMSPNNGAGIPSRLHQLDKAIWRLTPMN